jgi:hypothetical protein
MVDPTQFVLGIIGVFLGALAAFEFDKFRDRQNEKKQSIRILELLRRELEANLRKTIPAIRKNVEKRKLAELHSLELDIWEAVSNKIDSITNDKALEAIARAYYDLHTLERTLEWYRIYAAIYFSTSNEKLKPNIRKGMQSIASIILERTREPKDEQDRTVIAEMREAISEIDKEIKRLES